MDISMKSPDEVSAALRDARKAMGVSQKKLAKMCGLSQSTIARLETDITRLNPSYQTVFQVMDALAGFRGAHGEDLLSRKAGEIMHRRIIYVGPEDTLASAIEAFKDYDFPQLPVLDSDRHALGTVYQKDMLGIATQAPDMIHRRLVGSVMKGALPQIDRGTAITGLKPILENTGAVLVVHNGRAVGIITIYDILKNI